MVIFDKQLNPDGQYVEVWREFNLDESLNASFVLPFFEKHSRGYVKFYGWNRGLRIECEADTLRFNLGSPNEVLMLSGAWFNPHLEIANASRNARKILEKFLEVFPGLGIAINPWDKIGMLYTVFLSRNTDYYRNTVIWVKKIFKIAETEDKLSNVRFNNIGRSYQLRQLNKVRGKLTSILKDNLSVESHSLNKFLEIRKKLLSVEYCGPKIAHGYGLFSLGLTCLSQVDRHLLRIGEALGIIDPDDKIPLKNLCAYSKCFISNDCKIIDRCITYKMYKSFGVAAGWLQTATYLYGAKYLSKGKDPFKILRR